MPVKNKYNKKKKGKAKAKAKAKNDNGNGNGIKNKNSVRNDTIPILNAAESKEEFYSRIMEYLSRGHCVIIAPQPSFAAMEIASEAGTKIAARNTSSNNVATTTTVPTTTFMYHCGKRIVDLLDYDDRTKIVDVRVLLRNDDDDDDDDVANTSDDCDESKEMVWLKVPTIALVEELPSFPRAETGIETIERICGYEYVTKSETKLKDWFRGGHKYLGDRRKNVSYMSVGAIKKKLERYYISFLEGSELVAALEKARIDEGSTDLCIDEYIREGDDDGPIQKILLDDLVPDYDKEKAEWKIVYQIDVPTIDWARRANDCIDLVPFGRERDVYKAFLKYATNPKDVEIDITKVACPGSEENSVPSMIYKIDMKLLIGDYVGEGFELFCDRALNGFHFTGGSLPKYLPEYLNELRIFLMYQLMDHIINNEDNNRSGVIGNMYCVLHRILLHNKRYPELIAITIPAIKRAIHIDKRTVEVVAKMSNDLGMYLEESGMFETAALVYAEVGVHLSKVGYYLAYKGFLNSGFAWECNANINTGNVNVEELFAAERYYALALDSARFLYDPKKYRISVFVTLKHLFNLYLQYSPKVFSTSCGLAIRELLRIAGEEDLPGGSANFTYNTQTDLHPNLVGVGKERIICVIQSIVEAASKSPTAMRKAIRDSGNPDGIIDERIDETSAIRFPSKLQKSREKKLARLDIMQTCDACDKLNADHKFLTCPCNGALYCNKDCQVADWANHRTECTYNC